MVDLGTGLTDQSFLLPSMGEAPAPAAGGADPSFSMPPEFDGKDFADVLANKITPEPKSLSVPIVLPAAESMQVQVPQLEATPMQEFLTAIDKEANIKPEQWINAMMNMPVDDQLQSPWQSAEKVVSELNIDEKGKEKVLSLYENLLSKLQDLEESIDNLPKEVPTKDGKKISVEAMIGLAAAGLMPVVAKNQKAEMPKVDVKPQGKPAIELPKVPEKIDSKLAKVTEKIDINNSSKEVVAKDWFNPKEVKMDEPNMKVADGKIDISDLKPVKAAEVQDIPMVQMNPVIKAAPQPVEMPALGTFELAKAEDKPVAFVKNQNSRDSFILDEDISGEEQPLSSFISDKPEIPVVQNSKSFSAMQYQMESKPEMHKGRTLDTKDHSEEVPSDSKSHPDFFIDSMPNRPAESLAPKGQVMGPNAANGIILGKGDDANVNEVVRNAQVMVRQGGGEVKVKLHPESLGEVNMRMVVDGDKVHLALDTSNQEAKKVIESTINDLRSSLTASKLHLETVKVDVSARSDNQFSNNRFDHGGNASREQAKHFLQNFRDDNQSRRHAMAQENIPQVRSSTVSRPASRAVSRGSYNNNAAQVGRLNLVA